MVLSVDFWCVSSNDSLSPAAVLANDLYDIHLCLISSPAVFKLSRFCQISDGILLAVILSHLQMWDKKNLKWKMDKLFGSNTVTAMNQAIEEALWGDDFIPTNEYWSKSICLCCLAAPSGLIRRFLDGPELLRHSFNVLSTELQGCF